MDYIPNYDQWVEESHHPENFSPSCQICGGLTKFGECISNGCDLTREEVDEYDTRNS